MHSRILWFLFLILILESCSNINKAKDLITKPSAREVYKRDLHVNDKLFALWETEKDKSITKDSIFINLPYRESGKFFPKSFSVYSYLVELHRGDLLSVKIKQDTTSSLTFIDVFSMESSGYQNMKSSGFGEQFITLEIEEDNLYKIVVQPEIEASSFFNIEIKRSPLYLFPVAGGENSDAQSFWGHSEMAEKDRTKA